MAQPRFKRLVEARSLITHGLGENAPEHEAYIAEFRQMVAQVERMYPLWLIDRGKQPATIAAAIAPLRTEAEIRAQIEALLPIANAEEYSFQKVEAQNIVHTLTWMLGEGETTLRPIVCKRKSEEATRTLREKKRLTETGPD